MRIFVSAIKRIFIFPYRILILTPIRLSFNLPKCSDKLPYFWSFLKFFTQYFFKIFRVSFIYSTVIVWCLIFKTT